MENRKFVTIKKSVFAFVALLNFVSPTFSSRAYAYGVETHAGITREIVQFYNSNFPDKRIGETEAASMVQGSRDEDDAPRWMNHFYDPVYNRGLTNFFGTNWMSSKQWANERAEQLSALYNPIYHTAYGAVIALANPELAAMSDFTWRRALEDYARGDVARAFRGLGHVLHLLEDASVPDHTRNDPHPAAEDSDYFETGSPYEIWTHRFTVDNINLLQYLYTKKPTTLDSRDAYFDALANYSNKNFYSRDTIDGKEYSEPKPDYILQSGKQVYGYKRDADGDFRLVAFGADIPELEWVRPTSKSASLKDGQGDHILRDYWERLAPKAVQYGAGLVDLFLKEAEQLKNDSSFAKEKPKSPLAQVVDAVRGLFAGSDETVTSADSANSPQADSTDSPRDGLKEVATIQLDAPAQTPRVATPSPESSAKSQLAASAQGFGAPKAASVSQTPTPAQGADSAGSPQAERPNLAPPKPARFAGALGLPANAPLQPLPASTPCAYATGQSASRTRLILNEIAWMGSANSASDEWVELKNISGNALDVSGWQVIDAGEQIHVTLPPNTVIPASGLFLLERGEDDNAVPGIIADYTYSGALGNKNDGVRLFDNNCLLQDEVSGNPWPAGEAGTKRTMERALDLMWYTTSGTGPSGILGTPKMENSTRQAAQINLSRGGLGSAPPLPPQETVAPVAPSLSAANHIVISEVRYGITSDMSHAFVELYNPTDVTIDLTGWTIKKKSSTGTETAFVSATRLQGKTIDSHGYFLLVNDGGYRDAVVADATWATSYALVKNNAVVLYDPSDAKIDEMSWTEVSDGASTERKAVENGVCVSASGAGAFLGNGCDTDAATDFETRASPQPQNRASLPEPRSGASVTNFQVTYDKATQRVAFQWDEAEDARGETSSVQYSVYDVTAATTTLYTGSDVVEYSYRVSDIGRDYTYALQATDADGLAGDSSRATVTAQSPITALKFFNNPNADSTSSPQAGATDARLFLTFDAYPLFAGASPWGALVFSLNADPVRQVSLDTAGNWSPDDLTNVLAVRYGNYSGYQTRNSLILPDDASRVGSGGGLHNVAMRWSAIETDSTRSPQAGKFMIRHDPPVKAFTSADYLTVSIYDFAGSGGDNQWFRFAAADQTKYYFSDIAPVTSPPTPPTDVAVDRYDASRSEAIVGWNPVATDPDGINRDIWYELNRATSTAVERFDDATWLRFTRGMAGTNSPNFYYTTSFATSSYTYVFGVRAVDEFGYVSSVATTTAYMVP